MQHEAGACWDGKKRWRTRMGENNGKSVKSSHQFSMKKRQLVDAIQKKIPSVPHWRASLWRSA